MTATPLQRLRRFPDWLSHTTAPFRRLPLTLERRVTIGVAALLALLTLAVDLAIRQADSRIGVTVVLAAGLAAGYLLVAGYTRIWRDLRRQQQRLGGLHREAADAQALYRLTAAIQTSRSRDALSASIRGFVSEVLPDSGGSVTMRAAGQEIEVVTKWGTEYGAVDRTGSCYAIRDGQTFSSEGASNGFRCQHVERTYLGPYTCFPIKAETGTVGVLHLRYPSGPGEAGQRRRALGEAAASRIGIGLETIELHDLLRTQSLVDPLTGLNNRRALFDYARRVHAEAVSDSGTYSVIVGDVDRFKALNDSLGHSAGDAILVTFARHLQRHIRTQDFACRYGGEEFVILMPDASREVASQRAEDIRSALSSLRTTVPRTVWRLSASFGVATFPLDGNSFAEVLRRADEAMYDAKVAGRNRVTSWGQRSRRA